jgi:hypothetical protein
MATREGRYECCGSSKTDKRHTETPEHIKEHQRAAIVIDTTVICSADDESLLLAAIWYDVFGSGALYYVGCGVLKEVEVLKKLKLAILLFRPNPIRQLFPLPKKAIMATPRLLPRRSLAAIHSIMPRQHQKLSQPFIQSWCQKVVGGHLSLLDELINYPKAKRQHDLLAQTTMSLAQLRRAAAILPPPSTAFTRAHCRRT